MRVRPFFWGFFAVVCLGVLAWAVLIPRQAPAELSIHLINAPSLETTTSLLVAVTNADEGTLDRAHLVSQAWMPTMHMSVPLIFTTPEGQGLYLVQLCLSMAGPWIIAVSLWANGSAPLRQTLQVQVSPQSVPGPTQPGTAQVHTDSAGNPCAAAMASRATA